MPTDQLGCVPHVLEWPTLACYMLGSSGNNAKNLTANHKDSTCRERRHVPRKLKNYAVVFDRSRNLSPTLLPFSSSNPISLPLSFLCYIPFIIYYPFQVQLLYIAEILLLWR